MRKKCAIFICGLIFVFACGSWKITTYTSSVLCAIENGIEPGKVKLVFGDDGIFDLTFGIKVFRGRIYLTDNALKRLQVFARDGSLELFIGPKGSALPKSSDVRSSYFNFSVMGNLVIDSKDRLYVQNRIVPSESSGSDELDFSPSYILAFDKSGALQYTLGRHGAPNIPFDFIESIEVDRSDRLFVVSRKFNNWTVSRFHEQKLTFSESFSNSNFVDQEHDKTNEGKIDCIKILSDGEDFLISVAYYHGLRFKYRKIYHYSIKDRKITRTLVDLPDPKNEIFAVVEDSQLYLWNVEERRTRFMVLNFSGNIDHNILLKFDERRYFYQDILLDDSAAFYSFRVNKNNVEVLEWK
ncbi:MAG: hypothetical protein N2316_04350 [Spirochaetes bacterium]|nr:hypothetical protein [Spirochaetota bacterium]